MDHSQQAAERKAMNKTIYITMDMDWANDDVLADSVSLAEQLNILGVKMLDHMIVAPSDVYFLSSCSRIPPDLFLFSAADE